MTKSPNPAGRSAPGSTSAVFRFVSSGLLMMTIVVLLLVAYFTEHGIAVSRDGVIHTYRVRSQLNDLQLEITRARVSEPSLLWMRGNRGLSQSLSQSMEQSDLAKHTIDALRRLTADSPRQQQRLGQLGQLLSENVSAPGNQSGSSGRRVQPVPSERELEKAIRDRDKRIDSIVNEMQDEEELLLEKRLKAWGHLFERNVFMLGLAFAVVTLMLAHRLRTLLTEVAQTKDTAMRVGDAAESYRVMSARILELQDSERRRIARELHDSVGQYLAGIKINLSRIESAGGSRVCALTGETIELTDCAIQEVRTMSHLLHPPLLEELGFLPAARWYVDEYGKRSQLKVSLHVDEPVDRLPREVEVALFRVLQEALTNVYRHAAAQAVDIRIVCREGHVTLTVADDGKGIPEEIVARFRRGVASGIGLAGMRERLAEFGGQINVESSRSGAVVEAVIPTNECAMHEEGKEKMLRHANGR